VLCLKDGVIQCQGSPQEITPEVLAQTYAPSEASTPTNTKKTHHKEHKGHKEKRKENRELNPKGRFGFSRSFVFFFVSFVPSW